MAESEACGAASLYHSLYIGSISADVVMISELDGLSVAAYSSWHPADFPLEYVSILSFVFGRRNGRLMAKVIYLA